MSTVLLFGGGLVLIVAASELFTNAVEWAGFRMKLASGATGSLLAAIGTALPETVVPIVALLGGQPTAASVATGAVLGSAFLLLGVGTSVTGLAVLMRRRKRLEPQASQARRDLGVFISGFSVVLIAIVLPLPARVVLGVTLLGAYGLYVRATLGGGEAAEEAPEPLHLLRWGRGHDPHAVGVALQLVGAIVMLIVGSDLFVSGLDNVATSTHINPLTLALVVIPVATELPETLNSVLWVRSGDDHLAFGNIAGAAAFQACILGFIGLCFTPWRPDFNGVLSGLLTLGTAIALLVAMRRGSAHGRTLLLAGVPWVAYVVAEVAAGGHLGS